MLNFISYAINQDLENFLKTRKESNIINAEGKGSPQDHLAEKTNKLFYWFKVTEERSVQSTFLCAESLSAMIFQPLFECIKSYLRIGKHNT